jgi:hypothetical protein
MLRSKSLPILAGAAAFGIAGLLAVAPAQADLFDLTSCHITGSSCLGGNVPAASAFGTVNLTQSGANVNFDVVLNNGNTFVETGAGGGALFVFNDTLASTSVTNASGTINGVINTQLSVEGLTNQSPFMADGTGDFTASVFCTTPSQCNGNSPQPGGNINDLEFTVTNATLAQLEGVNADGNRFVADILCGSAQPQCTGGLTGPVDNNTPAVPAPLIGHGLFVLLAVGGVLFGGKLLERSKQRGSLKTA